MTSPSQSSSSFSSVLQLTDLNDFIAPSQQCIKPVKVEKNPAGSSGVVRIQDDVSLVHESTEGIEKPLQKAKITLGDCLACSGCITSAESVLIGHQNDEEFSRILEKNNEKQGHPDQKTIVVTISPQAYTSFAAKYHVSVQDAARKLSAIFRNLGCHFVFDSTFGRNFALLECLHEFIHRFMDKDKAPKMIPMLTSCCPGWICYAEKSQGEYILPYISTAKSPQQIMGSLVKEYLSETLEKNPNDLYHVTIMPCYDKKLEASRNDFYNEHYKTRDVDCVITPVEVESLLRRKEIHFRDVEGKDLDVLFTNTNQSGDLMSHMGSGSGGYCEYVFVEAARQLFGQHVEHPQFKTLKNHDMKEVVLEDNGQVLLRFAIANGFRNIQNVVQKLKRGKCPYDFIEIMACPSGCLNGGAQLRADSEEHQKDLLHKVEHLYDSLPKQRPDENPLVEEIYEWLGGADSNKAQEVMRTQYHVIEKPKFSLSVMW